MVRGREFLEIHVIFEDEKPNLSKSTLGVTAK
jgi:hypothetical protein